jgi:glycosyltransferase involved in cell wall biosynthesis
MHIGFVSTESPYAQLHGGGISTYLGSLLPKLAAKGHRVSLMAFAEKDESFWLENDRMHVIHLKQPNLHWYIGRLGLPGRLLAPILRQFEWSLRFLKTVRRLHRKEPFDILECTEVGGLFLHRFAPVVVRLHGSKFIFNPHLTEKSGQISQLEYKLQKNYYARAVLLSSPSQFLADQLKEQLEDHPSIAIIPNLVDDFWWAASKKKCRAPEERETPLIILYAGRLAKIKGVEVLLRAIGRLRQQPYRFVLAGNWQLDLPPAAYGIDEKHHWRGNVKWTGYLNRDQLLSWYNRASIFVMPSYFETFGLSVVEAMMMGLPVVASAAGALSEKVDHGITGLLVEPGDAAALAEAIHKIAGDEDKRLHMAHACKASWMDDAYKDEILKRTLDTYGKLLATKR